MRKLNRNKSRSKGSNSSNNNNNNNHVQVVGIGEFFQLTMNNGVQDGVACFKLLVLGMLLLAALVIGNAAFVFTTGDILDDYQSEVK